MKNKSFIQRIKSQRGVTMTELMISMTIVSMMGAAFFGAFSGMRNQMSRQNMFMATDSSAKNVMERISKDVKEATRIESSYGGNTTGTSVLILRLPSISAAGVPTSFSSEYDYVTYKLNPSNTSQLTRTIDVLNGTSQREGGVDYANIVIAKRVTSIQFTNSAGAVLSTLSGSAIQALKTVNAQITTQGTTMGTNQQTQLDSDLMLRNNIT